MKNLKFTTLQMKTLVKQFLCLFILLGGFYSAFAQEPGLDSLGIVEGYESQLEVMQEHDLRCISLGVEKSIPVLYENSYGIYIKITGELRNPIYFQEKDSEPTVLDVNSQGEAVLNNLPYDKFYLLGALNSCGVFEYFHAFYTNKDLYEGQEGAVNVFSEEMFLLASDFGGQELSTAIPLHQFLNEDKAFQVHPFEKLNFYQQYTMKGAKYPERAIGEMDIQRYNKDERRDCECNLITLSSHASIIDGKTFDENTGVSKYIAEAYSQQYSNLSNVNKNSWWQLKGAAKNISNYTSGWKADCDHTHSLAVNHGGEGMDETGNNDDILDFSPNYGQIAVSLLCNDLEDLPARCDCEKQVLFDYEYAAHMDAYAQRGSPNFLGCNANRQAAALAEDYVIVTAEERVMAGSGDPEVINIMDMATFAVEAECGTVLNEDWDEQLFTFVNTLFEGVTLSDIVLVLFGEGDIDQIINGEATIPEIVEALNDFIQTERFLNTPCTSVEETFGIDGHYQFTLEPNKELWFYIRSSGQTYTEGRRSWQATAGLRSSFAMTVQTSPGNSEGDNVNCCSPWGAVYNGGTFELPWDNDFLWSKLSDFLNATFVSFPDCTYTDEGVSYSKGDFGTCTTPAANENCNVPMIDVTERGLQELDLMNKKDKVSDVLVFNLLGQLLFKVHDVNLSEAGNLRQSIQDHVKLSNYPNGIYLISYHEDGQQVSKKIMLEDE